MGIFKPGLPFVRRIVAALFAKGGDMEVPAETPDGMPTVITIPHGILRDNAIRSLLITYLLWLCKQFDWDFGLTEAAINSVLDAGIVIFTTLAGIFRVRSASLTRG